MKTKFTKTKKIVATLLAFVLAFTCLASYDIGFAKTREIFVSVLGDGKEIADTTDGSGDLIMYKFVPEKSGMYTLFSLGARKSEAYLFIKEKKPDGSKEYRQLAFSSDSPNYEHYGQPHADLFCLTYHLEAGKTYYYGVGWDSESVESATMRSKLICEGYDENLIDHIEAECPVSLTWYTDGEWKTDDNKNQYYYYNISKIVANTKITVYYTDGTVKTATGVNTFDGMKVSYNHEQHKNHWYVKRDENYKSNDLTVRILDKSATINVNIEEGALYPVKAKVVDYVTNEPIANADVLLNSQPIATTDVNGNFAITSAPGTYEITIRTDNSIDNKFTLVVSTQSQSNDHTATPYKLITCDYVDDEVINTKDSAFVNRSDLAEEVKMAELDKINKSLGANESIYE